MHFFLLCCSLAICWYYFQLCQTYSLPHLTSYKLIGFLRNFIAKCFIGVCCLIIFIVFWTVIFFLQFLQQNCRADCSSLIWKSGITIQNSIKCGKNHCLLKQHLRSFHAYSTNDVFVCLFVCLIHEFPGLFGYGSQDYFDMTVRKLFQNHKNLNLCMYVTSGPFHSHGLTLISAWISNYLSMLGIKL